MVPARHQAFCFLSALETGWLIILNEKAEGFFTCFLIYLKVDRMKKLIFYMKKKSLSKFETKIRDIVIFTFPIQSIFFIIIYNPQSILRLVFNGVGS